MNWYRISLLAGAICLLLPLLAGAQAEQNLPPLDSRSSSRDFGGRSVSCELTARAGGDFTPGHRAYLQLDLDSTATGPDEAELLSTVVANGLLIVALPPGIEPDGQPRLMYFDAAKGNYQFMYSKTYPPLPRLAGTEAAIQNAGSGDPAAIFEGLRTISQALDPAVSPLSPAATQLMGGDPAYAVSGVSWLIPCNVYFKELVNLFKPEDSLGRDSRLRVSLALKVTEPVANPKITVYIGGLSAAVAKVEMLPADLPATALPLAPLPETPPAAGAEPAGAPEIAPPEDTKEQPTEDGNQPPDMPPPPPIKPEGQDEQPVAPPKIGNGKGPAAEPAPPPPPQKIPVLIYSYEWISWETELDLTPLLPEKSLKKETALDAGAAAAAVKPGEPSEADISIKEAQKSVQVESVPAAPGEGEAGAQPERPQGREEEIEATTPEFPPDKTEEPAEPAAKPPGKPAREEEPAGKSEQPVQETGVREVAPGTLPAGDETYTVPLKEIGGGGSKPGAPDSIAPGPGSPGATTPGGEQAAPADLPGMGEMVLIPEGYFLMGTGGNSSAGDADEQPQTQVFLPAYHIDKYPVSNRQFMEFILRSGYKPNGKWDKFYSPAMVDLPVREVSWNDAAAYAKWAGKRLPTEAEWEKAARGEDGRTYPWGEDWSAEILPRGEMVRQILQAPNGASPYGVMGMCGLLWQWTASAFAPYPFNPDAKGDSYVLRGGCFSNGRNVIRCANRYDEPPNVALNTFSFRCAKDAP